MENGYFSWIRETIIYDLCSVRKTEISIIVEYKEDYCDADIEDCDIWEE